jgi:hypothetical protein
MRVGGAGGIGGLQVEQQEVRAALPRGDARAARRRAAPAPALAMSAQVARM